MIRDTAILLAELTALFFGVTFIVQLIQRRLGPERLRAWMGGRPVTSALKGIGIGFVTPFCTFTAIPMLIGLRQAQVPPAGYVAFITAAPVLDPVLFGALVIIVGPGAATLYAAIAFVGAMGLALVAQRFDITPRLKPIPVGVGAAGGTKESADCPTGSTTCGDIGDGQPPWQGIGFESRGAAKSAVALLRSIGWLLLLGVGIGLLIEAAVSPDDVARITGGNDATAIPIAAALGTPLYFHTELFVPIADSLRGAGVGIGAIVALTISGAGANIPEFILLSRLAERRLIVVFVGYVFAVALTGGLIAQALLG